ncbi:MAG: hypothetical protein M9894_03105 [Planctomycetes bacterium]|nr:hypothetical protein [Planctomycetota bacterium]
MSPGPLQLEDEAFFGDPTPALRARLPDLDDAGFRGLLLDGPAVAPLAGPALPLAGLFTLTARQVEQGAPSGRALLVAACEGTGAVACGLALHPGKEPARRRPGAHRPPPGLPAPSLDRSVTGGAFALDAREQVGAAAWAPGSWTFWLVLRDLSSNPVRVRLDGPAPAAPAPPPWPAPVWPREAEAARYRDVEDAPPPPGAHGVALAAERALVPTEAGARWRLRAAWRLPVRPAERVPAAEEGRPPPPFPPDVQAVVPITLVITAAGAPGPWVVPLRVPCLALAGDEGTGQLEVDLLRTPGAPRAPGDTYFVYAVTGGRLDGPVITALVDEAALPREGP